MDCKITLCASAFWPAYRLLSRTTALETAVCVSLEDTGQCHVQMVLPQLPGELCACAAHWHWPACFLLQLPAPLAAPWSLLSETVTLTLGFQLRRGMTMSTWWVSPAQRYLDTLAPLTSAWREHFSRNIWHEPKGFYFLTLQLHRPGLTLLALGECVVPKGSETDHFLIKTTHPFLCLYNSGNYKMKISTWFSLISMSFI